MELTYENNAQVLKLQGQNDLKQKTTNILGKLRSAKILSVMLHMLISCLSHEPNNYNGYYKSFFRHAKHAQIKSVMVHTSLFSQK